jgi:putative hydrolase of the HAD superfamily
VTIKAVIFDIGGVLQIAPRFGEFGIFSSWEARLGLEPGQIGLRIRGTWDSGRAGRITVAEVHRQLAESLGWDGQRVGAFMADFWREYLGIPNTALTEYLRGLRPGYRTALLSNSFAGAREKEQELYQLDALTDLIIYSHEVGLAKPDRRIYELACDRLGVPAERVVFLDDNEQYVAGARAAGLHGVLFTGNAQAIADIEALLAG